MSCFKKKKTFVLLELLIAFALVSISILPFLRFPYLTLKKDLDLFFEMELQKKVENELADFYVALSRGEIDQKFFLGAKGESLTIKEHSWYALLNDKVRRRYDIVWTIQLQNQKIDKPSTTSLVKLKVYIASQNKRNKTSKITGEAQVCVKH